MKFSHIAAAAVAALSLQGAAHAAVDLGDLTPSASFSATVANGSFSHMYTFNFTTPSIVAASVTNVAITFGSFSTGRIDDFAAFLNGTPLNLNVFGSSDPPVTVTTQVLAGSTTLPTGTYQLVVSGKGVGSASYGGNIVATPVPEPQTYAMLLAGLGAVGFVAARRRRAD